jgi:hypothetical protein
MPPAIDSQFFSHGKFARFDWLGIPPVKADKRIEQISFLLLIWIIFPGILALDEAEC